MPMFDIKSPDAYPLFIHRAVDYLAEQLRLGHPMRSIPMGPTWASEADARREYRRFHAFKANVKRHPLHRHAPVLEKLEFVCSVRKLDSGFRLQLTAKNKGKLLADIKAAMGL